MCFGFSIRLVVAFDLEFILYNFQFSYFLDAFTNSRCVYPGFFDHSWTWLQRQAALGARCCSLWHSGFGFGVLTEQLGPLGQSASRASWWKSPVEVVVICGVFCGEDEWHIVTLKKRHRVLQCMNSIDQGIESWKFGLWEKVKQLDRKCRYKVLRDVHLLDRLKIQMRKKIHSSVKVCIYFPMLLLVDTFSLEVFISFKSCISPFPWIRGSHFRGPFGDRGTKLSMASEHRAFEVGRRSSEGGSDRWLLGLLLLAQMKWHSEIGEKEWGYGPCHVEVTKHHYEVYLKILGIPKSPWNFEAFEAFPEKPKMPCGRDDRELQAVNVALRGRLLARASELMQLLQLRRCTPEPGGGRVRWLFWVAQRGGSKIFKITCRFMEISCKLL